MSALSGQIVVMSDMPVLGSRRWWRPRQRGSGHGGAREHEGEEGRQSAIPSCNESLSSPETMARREEMRVKEKRENVC